MTRPEVDLRPGPAARRLFWRLHAARPERLVWRCRRAILLARARVHAAWQRSSIELDIDPEVRLGRGVRIVVFPRTRSVVRIAEGSIVDDGVLLRLDGGQVLVGPRAQLRANVVLNVGGRLELDGGNILSWGTAVHCSDSVRLEALASAAEHVTIADSTHHFTDPETFFYDNTRTAAIRVGGNTWICPKATITSGVDIGRHCIVGANSVVTRDVPDGHIATGIPATARPLELPWETARG